MVRASYLASGVLALFLGAVGYVEGLRHAARALGRSSVIEPHFWMRLHACDGASANELSLSGGGGSDRDKDYEVQFLFPDDDFGMNEEEEELDEDALFEREMAREMFDMLRGEAEELTVEEFMKWDDINDVLEAGVIDADTMALIIESIGVKQSMTFEQWLDTVELVNEVQLTLDGVDDSVQNWDPVAEQEKADAMYADEEDPTSESVKQMLRMFGLKPAGEEE